jgi:hypothetical protein
MTLAYSVFADGLSQTPVFASPLDRGRLFCAKRRQLKEKIKTDCKYGVPYLCFSLQTLIHAIPRELENMITYATLFHCDECNPLQRINFSHIILVKATLREKYSIEQKSARN